jgi:hypothetical protein
MHLVGLTVEEFKVLLLRGDIVMGSIVTWDVVFGCRILRAAVRGPQ